MRTLTPTPTRQVSVAVLLNNFVGAANQMEVRSGVTRAPPAYDAHARASTRARARGSGRDGAGRGRVGGCVRACARVDVRVYPCVPCLV